MAHPVTTWRIFWVFICRITPYLSYVYIALCVDVSKWIITTCLLRVVEFPRTAFSPVLFWTSDNGHNTMDICPVFFQIPPCCAAAWQSRWKIKCGWLCEPICQFAVRPHAPWILLFASFRAPVSNPELWSKLRQTSRSEQSFPTTANVKFKSKHQQIRK